MSLPAELWGTYIVQCIEVKLLCNFNAVAKAMIFTCSVLHTATYNIIPLLQKMLCYENRIGPIKDKAFGQAINYTLTQVLQQYNNINCERGVAERTKDLIM